MSIAICIALAIIFFYLAFDAKKLNVKQSKLPFSKRAELLGQFTDDIPLEKQQKLSDLDHKIGIGNTYPIPFLFIVIAIFFTLLALIFLIN